MPRRHRHSLGSARDRSLFSGQRELFRIEPHGSNHGHFVTSWPASRPITVELDVSAILHSSLVLFMVQAGLIIALSRMVGLGAGALGQPMVIAEIVAGIL